MENLQGLHQTPIGQALERTMGFPTVMPMVALVQRFLGGAAAPQNKLAVQPTGNILGGYVAEPQGSTSLPGGWPDLLPPRKLVHLADPNAMKPATSGKPSQLWNPLTLVGKPAEAPSTPQVLLMEAPELARSKSEFNNPETWEFVTALHKRQTELAAELTANNEETIQASYTFLKGIRDNLNESDQSFIDQITAAGTVEPEQQHRLIGMTSTYLEPTIDSEATNIAKFHRANTEMLRNEIRYVANDTFLKLPAQTLDHYANSAANQSISPETFTSDALLELRLNVSIHHLVETMSTLIAKQLKAQSHELDGDLKIEALALLSRYESDKHEAFSGLVDMYYDNNAIRPIEEMTQLSREYNKLMGHYSYALDTNSNWLTSNE